MIRKAITDTFYTLIHENFKFNGASELLDILARFFLKKNKISESTPIIFKAS